jgi:hypothetical protein
MEMTSEQAIALMMEAASASETSVNFYQTTRATTQNTVILILLSFTEIY